MNEPRESPLDTREWLMFVREQVTVLGEAYRLRLVGKLWWANLFFVVFPAMSGTAAAALAAASTGDGGNKALTVIAAWLAGGAAVLSAVHRSLKCEDYQTECLRLSQGFQSIRVQTEARLAEPNPDPKAISELAAEYARLVASAQATLPNIYIYKATDQTGYRRFPDIPARPAPQRWWTRLRTRLYSEPSARLTAR